MIPWCILQIELFFIAVLDDLPPPPPPLDISAGLPDYAPCSVNTNLPPPPKELLPPPSPVSSSYSELRRATQPGQDFHNYSVGSQVNQKCIIYLYNRDLNLVIF